MTGEEKIDIGANLLVKPLERGVGLLEIEAAVLLQAVQLFAQRLAHVTPEDEAGDGAADPEVLATLIQRHQRDRLDALCQLQLDRMEEQLATDAWSRGQGS